MKSLDGLALFENVNSSKASFTLWNPDELIKICKDIDDPRRPVVIKKINDNVQNWVVGFIKLTPNNGDTWDAWEVKLSAAVKGYGPTMYDIAMSKLGRITSSKESVSKDAQNVWNYYLNKRGDVKHLKFDDMKDPKTPSKEDDSYITGIEPLDYAYEGGSLDADFLSFSNDDGMDRFALFLEETYGLELSGKEVNDIIGLAGEIYFSKRYHTT